MNPNDFSQEVVLICRACGNDQFEFDVPDGDLVNAPNSAIFKCTHCGLVTTKADLIADNSESISAAVDDMVTDVKTVITKEIEKAFKKALR